MWVGTTSFNKDMLFISPEEIDASKNLLQRQELWDGVVYYARRNLVY